MTKEEHEITMAFLKRQKVKHQELFEELYDHTEFLQGPASSPWDS